MKQEDQLVFDGSDIRVVMSGAHLPSARLMVTFTPLIHAEFDPPVGFGQAFFAKHGIPCLSFVSSRPHWWQTPELFGALDQAREIAARYDQVVTYGSSMGGYGALLCSGPLGATEVIAACPQFSIDPAKAPFERRWLHHARKLDFVFDDMNQTMSRTAKKYVIYDPTIVDREHAALFDKRNMEDVRLAFAGHAPLAYLGSMKLLTGSILAMVNGEFDKARLISDVREVRKSLPDAWVELGRVRAARGDISRAVKSFEKAKALGSRLSRPRLELSKLKSSAGTIDDALDEIEQARALLPADAKIAKTTKALIARAIRLHRHDPERIAELDRRYRDEIADDPHLSALISRFVSVQNDAPASKHWSISRLLQPISRTRQK